jgi:hypothetical protein
MPIQESDWLKLPDLDRLLRSLCQQPSDRKLRLISAACCRRIEGVLLDARCREAIERLEEFADGSTTARQFRRAATAAKKAESEHRVNHLQPWPSFKAVRLAMTLESELPSLGGTLLTYAVEASRSAAEAQLNSLVEELAQAEIGRDILGNPFRPVEFAPGWRNESVVAIARQIYDDRDFAIMPILADALEDAGCNNPEILSHCRGPGPHVRGCWVEDLILEK